jgi:hypothetical protein
LVNDLQQRWGGMLKIVHGEADGYFGCFGGDRYLSYTFTFPQFEAALAALGRLEFGWVEELRC